MPKTFKLLVKLPNEAALIAKRLGNPQSLNRLVYCDKTGN